VCLPVAVCVHDCNVKELSAPPHPNTTSVIGRHYFIVSQLILDFSFLRVGVGGCWKVWSGRRGVGVFLGKVNCFSEL
jgi:hypothetical protein